MTIDYLQNRNVKILLLSSPGNPLGKIWSKEELEKISYLSEKHDFYILYDAVYKDIYFETVPYNPMELGNRRFFYIDSFSKMLSITGWRIGYIICDAKSMKKVRSIHDYSGLCATTLFQHVIAKYLDENNFGREYTASLRSKCSPSI